MRLRELLIVIGVLLAAVPESATAQIGVDWAGDRVWTQLYDSGLEFLVAERYKVAADTLEVALERARSFGKSDPRLRLTLERLKEVYSEWKRPLELESVEDELSRLPSPKTEIAGPARIQSKAAELHVAHDAGWEAFKRKDYTKSLELGMRGIVLSDSVGLPNSSLAGGCATLVAVSQLQLGQIEEAEEWALRPLAFAAWRGDAAGFDAAVLNLKAMGGGQTPLWITAVLDSCSLQAIDHPGSRDTIMIAAFRVHDLMGRIAETAGRVRLAEAYYREALAFADSIGWDKKRIGAAHGSLGVALYGQEKYPAALEQFEASHKAYLSLQPPNPSALATSVNNLALIARVEHNLTAADSLLALSLELMRTAGAEGDERFTTTLNSLAAVAAEQGRFEYARELIVRAMTIDSTLRGVEHVSFVRDNYALGLRNVDEGRYKDAEKLFKRAIATVEEVSPKHPLHGQCLSAYANLLRITFRQKDAEEIELKAAELKRESWQH